jgi:hypothetical protein
VKLKVGFNTDVARIVPIATATAACSCAAENDLRCACGSLLARLVAGGVEVKCRRCKRAVVLPVERGR